MIPPGSPLNSLIATSLFVGLVIALFLPLRPLLRRLIGSQWLCLLWLALLIRLLLPCPLQTPWGLMDRWQSQTPRASAQPWIIRVTFPTSTSTSTSAGTNPSPLPPASAHLPAPRHPLDIPLAIWLTGFLASLALLAWRRHQTRRLAAATLPATDERLLAIFSSIPATLRRNVQLRMTPSLNVPTLAGILRPQIWMPRPWLAQFTAGELRAILLHELGHARRRDLAVQWLFAFAQCLHWFNPFVWLAARAARFDREMACDAWVLGRDTLDASPAYGATLLKTAGLLRTPLCTPGATIAMASSRQNLRARIAGIGAFRPSRPWPGLLGIATMITALALLTTSRTIGETQTQTPTPSATQTTPNPTPQPSAPSLSGAAALPKRPLISISSKFLEIEVPAWNQLCAEDPALQKIMASGKFYELKEPPKSYATMEAELNDLRSGAWEFKKGAWETTSPIDFVSSLLSDEEMQKMLRSLDQRKGVDLLAAPRVTTRDSQRAVIEIVREFRYPSTYEPYKKSPNGWSPTGFVTKNLGVTLGVESYLCDDGGITLNLNPQISGFLGFLREKNGTKTFGMMKGDGAFYRPVFSTSEGEIQVQEVKPGNTIVLGALRIDSTYNRLDPTADSQMGAGLGPKTDKDPIRHIVLIFVTPELVASNGLPPDSAAATPALRRNDE
jgi:beta-lactamase regulating signal transducer with metallopeptidase domain